MVEDGHSYHKKLWSYIIRLRKDNSGILPLSHNGSMHTDPSQKVEILNSFFSSIFINNTSAPPSLEESLISDITPITVDIHGLKSLLDKLDSHKATGPDTVFILGFLLWGESEIWGGNWVKVYMIANYTAPNYQISCFVSH